ncbi:MAG: YadA-like family protein [Megasphaera elsdenii]|nr:YadA-like family protein [Megasphaera elsdenii]
MNRTYKVIWSKARHCYVVVSELTKSQHKSSSKSELISTNVHRGGVLGKAAVAAIVAGLLTFGGVAYSPVLAADNTAVTDSNGNTVTNTDKNITDINANITGKGNKVIDSSNAEIVGDGNTVTNEAQVRSDDARIVGSKNIISGSRNQQVIGDHNTIIGRDKGTVTDYGHPEGRDLSVADITIGRENTIHSGDTYRNEWDSLTVIGNHNIADSKLVDSADGPASGIVVGSNQNIDGIEESIVIGSLSPAEQNEKTNNPNHYDKYTVGRNSIILGNRSQGNGQFQTIMGHRSIIQGYADQSEANRFAENYGALSSIYGAFNTIESARPVFEDSSNYNPYLKAVDGFGNSINGTLNKTSSARGTMIMGAANTVTNSQPDIIKAKVFGTDDSMDDRWLQDVTSAVQYYNLGDDTDWINYDQGIAAMKEYAANASGAVSVLGNGNAANYAIRSQILGTANTLTGSNQSKISANNTINGYGNTGTNITHSAVVGSNNTLSNGEDNVVIGDYHNMNGGKHNVVLGSMKSEGKTVTKKYVSPIMTDMPIEYTVTEQVPIKDHTKDIKNAVMVGYNTDVTQNGGVALGSDSVASTEAGKTGYDAQGKKHNNSDTDYSAWVSTDAAVSVGGADREVTYDVLDKNGKPVIDKATGKKKQGTQIVKSTRQITNLAAGTENTDAVNVAQLESVDKKVAVIFDDKGSLMSTDARMTHDIGSEGQSLALGKGAHAWMQAGSKANMILFGMQKAAGAIAIGEGAEALSQSIDIGNRTYTGDIGDVTISKYGNSGSGSGVGSVLLGTNSYTGGTFSTLIGDYSIMSTVYPNNYDSKKSGSSSYLQNAGAVSVGALNSIESATSSNDFSGVANSIVGLANKTNNANGALIYGAGNTITNSFADVATPDSAGSAAKAAQSFRKSVQNNPGGAALAIGGGNTIDRSIRSQVIGVNNKLTGNLYHEDGIYAYGYPIKPAVNEYSNQYNMVDGYNNQVANVNHAYVIGANNIIQGKTFTDATKNGVLSSKADRDKAKKDDNLIVIGDNHTLANDVSNNIILGTADKTLTTSVSNAVMIGHNADVQKNGGVALGADSIAYTEAKKTGYDPQGKAHDASDAAWVSTDAAVSVGGADREVKYKDKEGKEKTRTVKSTRQITNVAAGTQDTDAVNVAQLKAVSSAINTDITASKTHFYSVNSTDTKAKNYNNNGATGTNALAAGVGASAEADHSIAIGTGAWTNEGDGRVKGSGDIAIGHNATIHNYVNQSGSIALGQNALIENTFGSTEKNYAFNQTTFTSYGSGFLPADANKEATGIAIGRNSFARTGSLMVGTHMYKGAIADMDEVDGTNSDTLLNRDFNNINMTTLGTNSFNNGTFATVTGAYSATTAKKKIQNFAATIDGSLNSIESYKYQDKDAADNSGVASSIVGTANRIANSNNTTILGAGNEVTNSLTDIVAPKEGGDSAKDLQDTLKGKLQQDEKGAIVVSGIGNTVDSSHGVSVLGSRNVVKTTDNIQLLGDNREVAGANGSVIIGSADSKMRTSVTDATILGHNANVEKTGGVALGAGSVASREAGVAGYDPATKTDSTDSSATWKATDAAVSVGKADGTMTRQITGVAAGSAATDAVNVAQLQKALSGAKDGNDTLKSDTNALTLNGNTLSMNVEDTAGHTVSGSVNLSELAQAVDTNTTYTLTGEANPDNNTTTITFKDSNGNKNSVTVATKDTDTRNTVKAGENVTLDTKDNADGSHEYTVNVKADGKVEAGSTKIVSGGTVYNETRVAKDGAFVKQSNTAGENLSALDNQVTANTESIYHMNGRISDLDNRVNKVGAGAAALAALHPLDFDPDDKWDFAVGYGNYRNANSVALGAFYRPNEDTMFSLGTNFGNGENMFNAGVSFKIGQGSGITTSKTAMAKKIESLENTVDQQDKKIAELEALVKEQGEMIRQYVGKK